MNLSVASAGAMVDPLAARDIISIFRRNNNLPPLTIDPVLQAAALEKMLADRRRKLDAVIELRVNDDDELVRRVSGRYTCAKCGEGYHDATKQPRKPGVCDKCGSTEFKRRADDSAAAMKTRLLAYYKETSPLIGYYTAKGSLYPVDGLADMKAVDKAIGATLDKLA